jgi:oxygen-independent coproporphyrinogen-3 oxidase
MPNASPLFGIYIHYPFCAAKCPYCDFNSHVREKIDHAAWAQAYCQELQYYADLTKGQTVTSVFFGGGTPSLMPPSTVQAILDQIATSWNVAKDLEITLEANPSSVEAEKFTGFRTAGINRVSVGVQSFNDADLKFLGRLHDATSARKAIDIAANTFDRFSFDLIYARPNQTLAAWKQELGNALALGSSHLSLYQLTIEEGTPFYTRHQRGEFQMPDNDLAADFYELTQDMTAAAGLPSYEISNHARAGQESFHNLTYWRYGDYVGVGPGSHGRLTLNGIKQATRAHRAPEIWLERVGSVGHGADPFETVAPNQRFKEMMMMGLRLKEGVPLTRIEREAGKPFAQALDNTKLQHLIAEGDIRVDDQKIVATAQGLRRLDAVLRYLLGTV